jgi:hypothetical protein
MGLPKHYYFQHLHQDFLEEDLQEVYFLLLQTAIRSTVSCLHHHQIPEPT